MVEPIVVGIFPGASCLALYFGHEQGLYADAGCPIELRDVTGARNQVERFTVHTEFDLVQTAFDNVLSMNTGRFEELPAAPARVIAGGDSGFLSLVGHLDFDARAQRGPFRLGVDSPSSGYAFAMFELLEARGVGPDAYTLVSCGGGRERAQALRDDRTDASVSYPPHDAKLIEEGYAWVIRAGEEFTVPYQANVMAGLAPWLEAHPDAVRRFVGAYREAMAQMVQPAHRDACIAVLQRVLALAPRTAAAVYDQMAGDPHGFDPGARARPEAMDTVIRLREKWGGVPLGLTAADVSAVPADA